MDINTNKIYISDVKAELMGNDIINSFFMNTTKKEIDNLIENIISKGERKVAE